MVVCESIMQQGTLRGNCARVVDVDLSEVNVFFRPKMGFGKGSLRSVKFFF